MLCRLRCYLEASPGSGALVGQCHVGCWLLESSEAEKGSGFRVGTAQVSSRGRSHDFWVWGSLTSATNSIADMWIAAYVLTYSWFWDFTCCS